MDNQFKNTYSKIQPSEQLLAKTKRQMKNTAASKQKTFKLKPVYLFALPVLAICVLTLVFTFPRAITPDLNIGKDFFVTSNISEIHDVAFISNRVSSYSNVTVEGFDSLFVGYAFGQSQQECSLINFKGYIKDFDIYLSSNPSDYGILGFVSYTVAINSFYNTFKLSKILPESSTITVIQYVYSQKDVENLPEINSYVDVNAFTGYNFTPTDSISQSIGLSNAFISYSITEISK